MRKRYYTEKGLVLGLRPYHYVLLEDGERRGLTFYAKTRDEADKSAIAWAKPHGKIYRRKK